MSKVKLIPPLLVFIGLTMTSYTDPLAKEESGKIIKEKSESIKLKIKVSYLGDPLEGAVISIVDQGKVVAKSTTNKRGKVKIRTQDLGAKTVDLKVMKEGYQTQILSGVILVDKAKYEFSLAKGEGVLKSEVETDIPDIEEKYADKIDKFDKKRKKHLEKIEKFAQKEEEENKKRRAVEKETQKIERKLNKIREEVRKIENQLITKIGNKE